MEVTELRLVVVSFSPWKSVESVGEKIQFCLRQTHVIL